MVHACGNVTPSAKAPQKGADITSAPAVHGPNTPNSPGSGPASARCEVRGANTNVGHPEGWPTSALEPAGPADTGQLVVTAVSSTTKLVWSEESSTPLNFRVTVEPANEDRSKVFWAYPVALLRLE